MIEFGHEDTRTYSSIRKLIKGHLLTTISDIMFEDFVFQNQSQRILVEDMQKFALQLAIENESKEDKGDIGVMCRAAKVLRKCIANFILEGRQNFKGLLKMAMEIYFSNFSS